MSDSIFKLNENKDISEEEIELVSIFNNSIVKSRELFNKYKNNNPVANKIIHYIQNIEPTIEKFIKELDEKNKKREKLIEDKDNFINNFLQTHNYSYCSNTELFFNYDGTHYTIYDEDNIHHEILKSIRNGQTLIPIKHKIKSNIFKQIKDTSPMKYIPESNTIQCVINHLYPMFNDKDSIKYFLTLIGDNILKKNENIIYIISHNYKYICDEIIMQSYNLLGLSHIFNAIKYKYYDHNYNDCRLIMTSNHYEYSYKQKSLDKQFYKNILDFICVACHYSNRYGNADTFLSNCVNEKLKEHALFLKNNTLDNITDTFINSLEKCNGVNIKWKNILYLWKLFLNKKNIPSIVFNSKLKSILTSKIKYDEENELFLNVTSIHLPLVSKFLKFWEETIIKDEDETDMEIGEICYLFKNWSKNTSITENNIIDLIQHFYNDVIIEEDKYVHQISCKLWNKKEDILNTINDYKSSKKGIIIADNLHNVYQYYCENYKDKQYIISKRYFEKTVIDLIGYEFIENNLINPLWWNS